MTQTLYVGNLAPETSEEGLELLFAKYGNVVDITMKGAYAFVVYETIEDGERAISCLNGLETGDSVLIVQPSHQQRMSQTKKPAMGKVQVASVPSHVQWTDLRDAFGAAGNILQSDSIEGDDPTSSTRTWTIVYETVEQAEQAVRQFHGTNFRDVDVELEVKFVEEMRPLTPPSPQQLQIPGHQNRVGRTTRGTHTEFPLRILVPSDMVGAIIGREGNTIRMLTQKTKARVDVHRKENPGALEKAVTILGTEDSCSSACYEILRIMQDELIATTGYYENGLDKIHPLPTVPLKILAHDDLVGRLIGRGGYSLKKIAAETGTRVNISKQAELTPWNMERTVTIAGPIEFCSRAEREISRRLRQFYEDDMAKLVHQAMPTLNAARGGRSGSYSPNSAASMSPSPPQYSSVSSASSSPLIGGGADIDVFDEWRDLETVYVYVPSVFVNSVFGPHGANLPSMCQLTKAVIHIQRGAEVEPQRTVQITGTAESQWRAQLMIYNKLKEEGMAMGDDVKLTTEITLPPSQISVLKGRGGAMLREVQMATGAQVDVPRLINEARESPVRMHGTFQATQAAQRRIRSLLAAQSPILSSSLLVPSFKGFHGSVGQPWSASGLSAALTSSLNPWASEFHFPAAACVDLH
ncbi:insulin-like growth factor 2 mRNA-binding protein 2 isoform X2 [Oscarella lobularis]|uniref:insulin-like growth factor 2 mRNA-binding protein 2 isoform X2 n=1 Tax=Oscarella lobularis TaxID=121494 RepID=UPI0033143B58